MNYVEIDGNKHGKKHSEQVDYALSELRKQLKKDNFQYELQRREFYMSPSARKRFRKNESLKRRKRENRKQEWFEKNHSS